MIKVLSTIIAAVLLSTSALFAQCPDLPAARFIQPDGGCNGNGTLALGSGPVYVVPIMNSPQSACAIDAFIDNFSFNTLNSSASGCNNNSSNYSFSSTPATEVIPDSTYSFSI